MGSLLRLRLSREDGHVVNGAETILTPAFRDRRLEGHPRSVSNPQRPGRKSVCGLRNVQPGLLMAFLLPVAAKVLRVG